MANSKSNIYPIQLQGAELCLNRFDAEIKQYSGFNKNNSPFVGGCLSNIFTKDTTIEGGNADNIYVDTNGDVYRVDAEGLYVNDNKVINYPDTVKFYQKRKLNLNKNVVKALNESVYISVYNNNYVAHWGDNFSAVIGTTSSTWESFLDISYKDGIIVFTYKRYWSSGNIYAYLYTVIVPDETKEYYYRDAPSEEYTTTTGSNVFRKWNIGYEHVVPKTSQAAYINAEENYIYVAWNEDNFNYGRTGPHQELNVAILIYKLAEDRESLVVFGQVREYFTNNSGNNVFTVDLTGYYMTNDGVFHFTHLPYGISMAPAYSYTFPTLTGYYHIYTEIRVSITFNQYNNIDTFTLESDGCLNSVCFSSGASGHKVVSNSGLTKGLNPYNNFFSPYGLFFNSCLYNYNDMTYAYFITKTDLNKNYVLLVDGDHFTVNGGVCLIGDFKLLINNGVVSNISVANFTKFNTYFDYNEKSINGALLEDWNTISDIIIPASGDKITYKKDGDFYVIERTDVPMLSLKYNQVVVNCNSEFNAYNLDLKEVVHFASDWNNAYLMQDVSDAISAVRYMLVDPDSNTTYFLAAAVNEYNQKYNPSLLLNMQQVYIDQAVTTLFQYSYYLKGYISNGKINVYFGSLASNNAEYELSSGFYSGFSIDSNLVGLSFPNNTDGNVQYNPNIFSEFISSFGTEVFVKNDKNAYQLIKEGQTVIMSYFLATLTESLDDVFIIQGQYYGIINNQIFALAFSNGVVTMVNSVVSIQGLQFCGNTPYEALFYSSTNKCLYSFTGANVLSVKQFVDKISEVITYKYNPATQTVFLITDIGVLVYSLFGIYCIEFDGVSNLFLIVDGIIICDNSGNYRYIKYYLDADDTDYTKQNIQLETMFYGMNNETVTINDCLYVRLFSEEHESGDLVVSASTLTNEGRKTENTTFKIKSADWDNMTHSIYLRYQPKEQRGLGVSFSINSPFKIASLSVGSQPDAILVDKISKKAINAPQRLPSANEW